MLYSTEEEDIGRLIRIEDDTSREIELKYNDFKNNVSEWIKSVRAEVLATGIQSMVAYIDDAYRNGTRKIIRESPDFSGSFIAVSRRLKVGSCSMETAEALPQRLEEVFDEAAKSAVELDISFTGHANLNVEAINEFKNISNDFKNALNEVYDSRVHELNDLMQEYLLAKCMYSILEPQIRLIIDSVRFADLFYEKMLDWYTEAIRLNETIVSELNEEAKKVSGSLTEAVKYVANVIRKAFDTSMESGGAVSSSSVQAQPSSSANNVGGSKSEDKKDSSAGPNSANKVSNQQETMYSDLVKGILKDLGPPEAIEKFKSMVNDGLSVSSDAKQQLKDSDDAKKDSILNRVGAKLKKLIGDSGKTLLKIASLIVSMFAPGDSIASKIVSGLSGIIDWVNKDGSTKDDIKKAEFALKSAKSALPEGDKVDPSKFEEYINKNKDKILKSILSSLIDEPEYSTALNIKQSELNDSPTVREFRRSRGETVLDYPKPYSPISYVSSNEGVSSSSDTVPRKTGEKGFLTSSASGITNASNDGASSSNAVSTNISIHNVALPTPVLNINIDIINEAANNVKDSPFIAGLSQPKLRENVDTIMPSLKDNNGYVSVPRGSEVEKLISGIRDTASKNKMPEFLKNIDGRYNKAEITDLFSQLDGAKKTDGSYDIPVATKNFLCSQCGYPIANNQGILVVKKIKELIAIPKIKPDKFIVQDDEVKKVLIKADEAINIPVEPEAEERKVGKAEKIISPILGLLAVAGVIGVLATNPWGIPFACLSLLGGGGSGNSANDSYAYLVSEIGEEAADFILKTYICRKNSLFAQTISRNNG